MKSTSTENTLDKYGKSNAIGIVHENSVNIEKYVQAIILVIW